MIVAEPQDCVEVNVWEKHARKRKKDPVNGERNTAADSVCWRLSAIGAARFFLSREMRVRSPDAGY